MFGKKMLTRLSAVAVAVFASVALVACGGASGYKNAEDMLNDSVKIVVAEMASSGEKITSLSKESKFYDLEADKINNIANNEFFKEQIDKGQREAQPTDIKDIRNDLKAQYNAFSTADKAMIKAQKKASTFDKKYYNDVKKYNKQVANSIKFEKAEIEGEASDEEITVDGTKYTWKESTWKVTVKIGKELTFDATTNKVTGTKDATQATIDEYSEFYIDVVERDGKFFLELDDVRDALQQSELNKTMFYTLSMMMNYM